ncbi:MAG TPA: DUF4785 domain-containing protein [Patescibacteria group bacterium]|nr:DUF4785 domain-containing protein [Patescibacteria group bacterium]
MTTKTLLSIALACALSGAAAAARFETDVAFERDANDLVPTTLVSAKAAMLPGMNLERQTVHFSWALPTDQKIEAQQPFVRESKEYWTRVPGAELAKGMTVRTTSTGALIRLSPVSGDAKSVLPISADDVVITALGKALQGRDAMANAANDAELKMAGTDFPDGTLAFQLRDDIGPGAITLSMPKAAGDYLVHVYEPNSSEILKLTMDRIVASHGQTYKVFASYNGNEALDRIDGLVSAPNGATVELGFKRAADGRYVAELAHDALAGAGPGLWEVHAFASAKGASVQRDAKTAFSSSIPRAQLGAGAKAVLNDDGSLSMSFKLRVAAESRFEVRGTLYGMDGGKLRPAAQASTAAMLKPGNGALELVFDAATMAKGGVSGPYQLRDLTLIDQADLSTVELRRAGLRVALDR